MIEASQPEETSYKSYSNNGPDESRVEIDETVMLFLDDLKEQQEEPQKNQVPDLVLDRVESVIKLSEEQEPEKNL